MSLVKNTTAHLTNDQLIATLNQLRYRRWLNKVTTAASAVSKLDDCRTARNTKAIINTKMLKADILSELLATSLKCSKLSLNLSSAFNNFSDKSVYISYFREAVLEGSVPSLELHALSFIYAAAFFALGALVYRKSEKKFIYYV